MPSRLLRVVSALLVASATLLPAAHAFAQTPAQTPTQTPPQTPTPPAATTPAPPAATDTSGTLRHIGGGVSAPTVIYTVIPKFSDEAKKQKIAGAVLVNLIVDAQGMPQNVHVLRGVGHGLDENAVAAVRMYRFKPAMLAGKPVPVELNVEVNFNFIDKPSAPADSDPKFTAAIAEGKHLTATGQLNFAFDAYKKANKIKGGKCAECLRQMVDLEMKQANFKDAAEYAAQLLSLATTPLDRSEAEWLRGDALYMQAGEKPKPAQLQAADEVLKAAIADFPKNLPARFCDGAILARLGQLDAAREQFEACVAAASPNDPAYLRAKLFAANPAVSYARRAPAFTVNALDGSKFTLDAMGGRVVLIDFWATWCGPCNEELPHMKKIAREFAGQPLVIISISWDSDEQKWKQFIQKNEMTWVQYRDTDHSLSKLFGVDAIPHYFTIDSDGVLTSEMLGSGSDVEGKLRKLVARARAAQAAATPATAALTPPANPPQP